MKVTSISIKHVMGFKEKSIVAGKVTEISGGNAVGKTSLLEAVKATLGRGALGRLARVDSDEAPETVLILDDGAIRVERTAKTTTVKRRVGDSAAYETVPRAQEFLASLFDSRNCNPVELVRAKAGELLDRLLEALPLEMKWAGLPKKLGVWPKTLKIAAVSKLHPLVGLALIREALYDERTGVNRSQGDKASSAYELKKKLPAEAAESPEEQIAEAEKEQRKMRASETAQVTAEESREARLQAEAAAATSELERGSEGTQAGLRAACERKCALLEAVCRTAVKAEKEAAREKINEGSAARKAELAQIRRQITTGVSKLATLRERAEQAVRDEETRNLADRFEAEAEELKLASGLLSNAIATLDETRRALAENLPIKGLEVRGKELYLDGVPEGMLNTEAKTRLAAKVAVLSVKDRPLPVLFVDGAEALEAKQRKLLMSELEKSPVQVFLARVQDEGGPLRVEASS